MEGQTCGSCTTLPRKSFHEKCGDMIQLVNCTPTPKSPSSALVITRTKEESRRIREEERTTCREKFSTPTESSLKRRKDNGARVTTTLIPESFHEKCGDTRPIVFEMPHVSSSPLPPRSLPRKRRKSPEGFGKKRGQMINGRITAQPQSSRFAFNAT